METRLTYVLSILFIIVGLSLLFGIRYYREKNKQIYNERIRFVKASSKKLSQILQLNSTYHFFHLENPRILKFTCRSKAEYDHFDYKAFFQNDIANNLQAYLDLIEHAKRNLSLYAEYMNKWDQIMSTHSEQDRQLYLQYDYFRIMETNLCQDACQHPVTAILEIVEKHYSSPQGRNIYSEAQSFSHQETIDIVKSTIKRIEEKGERERTAAYQRQMVTPKLRYQVLKRDHYRCVICGAEQSDGVKLHVDHIKPVSKGGKTELSNLKTLCDRCNLGKGASYDPDGIN